MEQGVIPTASTIFRRKRIHMSGSVHDMVDRLRALDGLKKDFLCPDALAAIEAVPVVRGKQTRLSPQLRLGMENGEVLHFPFNNHSLGQMANRYKVGLPYTRRMAEEAGDLFATNFNYWMDRSPKTTLWRTFDGHVRAVLSQKFKMLDNTDIVLTALKEAARASRETNEKRGWFDPEGKPLNTVEVFGWHLNENRVHVLIFDPTITAHLPTNDLDPNVKAYVDGALKGTIMDPAYERNGVVERLAHAVGRDPDSGGTLCFPTCEISNHEGGGGMLRVVPGAAISVCSNIVKIGMDLARVHIGRDLEKNAEAVISRETRRKENEVVYLKAGDAVRSVFSGEAFEENVTRLIGSMEVELKNAEEAIDVVVKRESFTEGEREAILTAFAPKVAEDKVTVYDVAMAVTSAAQKYEGEDDGERTIAMEDAVAPWFLSEEEAPKRQKGKVASRYFAAVLKK